MTITKWEADSEAWTLKKISSIPVGDAIIRVVLPTGDVHLIRRETESMGTLLGKTVDGVLRIESTRQAPVIREYGSWLFSEHGPHEERAAGGAVFF